MGFVWFTEFTVVHDPFNYPFAVRDRPTPSASRENPGIVLTENISTVALLPLERMLDVVRAGSEWELFPSGWEIGWKLGGCTILWAISVKLGHFWINQVFCGVWVYSGICGDLNIKHGLKSNDYI